MVTYRLIKVVGVVVLLPLQPPLPEEPVNLHFIALAPRDGYLYEFGKFMVTVY